VSAAAPTAIPGAADPDGNAIGEGIGGWALAVLAEAEVLTVLAGDGSLTQAGITRRVDAGYRALVPAALTRLAGQGLVEPAGGHGPGRAGWRLAG
jgi:hypothetical protein